MSLTGYNFYGNQNIENQNNQDGLTGITYNENNDETTIDNNVLITLPHTLTLNNYNVDTEIQSLKISYTALTGVTYNSETDTTQIDNNVTITTGKNLIVDERNILNELNLINSTITDISFNNESNETLIDNNVNITGEYLKIGTRIILDELDTHQYNLTNITFNDIDTTNIGNNVVISTDKNLIVNDRNILSELDTHQTSLDSHQSNLDTINTNLTDITYSNVENRTTIWNNLYVFDMDIKNSIEKLQADAISSLSYDAANNLTICNSNFKITGDLNMDLGVLYNSVSVICNYLQTKINFSYVDINYDLGFTNLFNTYLQAGSYYIDYFQPNGSVNYHLKDASNNSVFYKLDGNGLNMGHQDITNINNVTIENNLSIPSYSNVTSELNNINTKINSFEEYNQVITIVDDFLEFPQSSSIKWDAQGSSPVYLGQSLQNHPGILYLTANSTYNNSGIVPTNTYPLFSFNDIVSIDFVFKPSSSDTLLTLQFGLSENYTTFTNSVFWQFTNTGPGYYQAMINNSSVYTASSLNSSPAPPPFSGNWLYCKITNVGSGNCDFYIINFNSGYDATFNYRGGAISSSSLLSPIVKITNTTSAVKYIQLDYLSIKYKANRMP